MCRGDKLQVVDGRVPARAKWEKTGGVRVSTPCSGDNLARGRPSRAACSHELHPGGLEPELRRNRTREAQRHASHQAWFATAQFHQLLPICKRTSPTESLMVLGKVGMEIPRDLRPVP